MRHTQSYWVEWSLGINVQPKQMEEWMAGRRGSIREWGEGLSREQPIKAIVTEKKQSADKVQWVLPNIFGD